MRDSWAEMIRALEAFKKKNGHCIVPTAAADNPRLGRWVAAQRYKGRVGELPPERVSQLTAIGFVWTPSEVAWKGLFERLLKFRKARGNCNVPERYPKDQVLASWVQRQRINRRKGKLTSERVRLLEQVGFRWAIYKADKRVASGGERASEREPAFKRVPEREREKLYCLSEGVYVQYGGKGAEPAELKEYVRSHRGNYPPYIPLPRGKTTFVLGERYAPGARKVVWNGNGPLPADVLRHVRKQGVLPNHG